MKRVPSMADDTAGKRRAPRLFEMQDVCSTATAAEEAVLVMRLTQFIALGHAQASRVAATTIPVDQIHAWVASGAALTAVAALLGRDVGYMLSRAPGGTAMATVVVEGRNSEHSCFGETEAIALCGAMSAALAADLGHDGAGPGSLVH